MSKEIVKVDNWFSRKENISLLQNGTIIFVALLLTTLVNFLRYGYDLNKLFSVETIIDSLLLNGIMLLIKYAINDLTIVFYRIKDKYKDEIEAISEIKKHIETKGIIYYLQLYRSPT